MRDGMTIIKTFISETEAQVALNHLEALGVAGLLEADNCGGMRPHLDLTSGVHLLVADQDKEKALALLRESAEEVAGPPWTCQSCGEEILANFSACWKCGAEKA